MRRRLIIAALVALACGALAACFSTPGWKTGGGDDTAHGGTDAGPGGGTDGGGVDAGGGLDTGTQQLDGAMMTDATNTAPCFAGKPCIVVGP